MPKKRRKKAVKKRLSDKQYRSHLRKSTLAKLRESFHFSPDTTHFTLPFTNIQHPLSVGGNNLNLSLVEVGCRHCGKPAKLKETRKLVHDFWIEYYQNQAGIEWMPEVFRVLAHYNSDCEIVLSESLDEYYLDSIVHYHTITENMLKSLSKKEKKRIYDSDGRFCRNTYSCERLEDILRNNDSEELHRLILFQGNEEDWAKIANLRGGLAELLVLKDIRRYAQQKENFYFEENGDINFPNKRYCNGTEIDGLAMFYKSEDFYDMLNYLDGLEHTTVQKRY